MHLRHMLMLEEILSANLHLPTATGCCDVDCVESYTHPAICIMLQHVCRCHRHVDCIQTLDMMRSPTLCNALHFCHLHSFDAVSCCIINTNGPHRRCRALSRADHAIHYSACGLTIDAKLRLVLHSPKSCSESVQLCYTCLKSPSMQQHPQLQRSVKLLPLPPGIRTKLDNAAFFTIEDVQRACVAGSLAQGNLRSCASNS
jgi:hypothetical protein